MRTIKFEFYGETYHLRLTSAALYDIYEKFGRTSVFENITGSDKAAFDAICWYLAKLSEQGELTRRWQGMEPGKVATEEQLRILMKPADLPAAKLRLLQAMNLGFGREVPDEEPTDIGFAEFQKKATPEEAEPGRGSCRWLRRCWAFLCGKPSC